MMEMSCRDAGFACETKYLAKTEEELLTQVRQHASEVHGFEEDDFTPELTRKIKTLIKRS